LKARSLFFPPRPVRSSFMNYLPRIEPRSHARLTLRLDTLATDESVRSVLHLPNITFEVGLPSRSSNGEGWNPALASHQSRHRGTALQAAA
jgi:hypothetical protein